MTPLSQSLTVRGKLMTSGHVTPGCVPAHNYGPIVTKKKKKNTKNQLHVAPPAHACCSPLLPRVKKKANYLLCAAAPATTAQK